MLTCTDLRINLISRYRPDGPDIIGGKTDQSPYPLAPVLFPPHAPLQVRGGRRQPPHNRTFICPGPTPDTAHTGTVPTPPHHGMGLTAPR